MRAGAAMFGAALLTAGCVGVIGRVPAVPIALEIPNPIVIPTARAHTNFQKGRQV
jgi:hypothetical protein